VNETSNHSLRAPRALPNPSSGSLVTEAPGTTELESLSCPIGGQLGT